MTPIMEPRCSSPTSSRSIGPSTTATTYEIRSRALHLAIDERPALAAVAAELRKRDQEEHPPHPLLIPRPISRANPAAAHARRFFGARPTSNRSWLVDAGRSSHGPMRCSALVDALSHGWVAAAADAYKARVLRAPAVAAATGGDDMLLLRPLLPAISYAGLLLDLAAPIILFCCSPARQEAPPSPASWPRAVASSSMHAISSGLASASSRGSTASPSSRSSRAQWPPPPSSGHHHPPLLSPPPSPRRWARRLLTVLAVPSRAILLRHLVLFQGGKSSLWTDEGHLYAWHMKLVERKGSLVLTVQTAGGAWHHEEEEAEAARRTFHRCARDGHRAPPRPGG